MRVAALDLPALALQLALADRGLSHAVPAALVTPTSGRDVVVSVTACAHAAGARPGQSAAHARVVVPSLTVLKASFPRTGAALSSLAEALESLAPAVELSPPESLLLDASAARYWWGAEEEPERRWAEEILQVVGRLGLGGRVAVADTPAGARLVAAALSDDDVRLVAPGRTASALAGVSVRVLAGLEEGRRHVGAMAVEDAGPALWPEFSKELFLRLDSLGIRRLGGVQSLSAEALLERLGREGEALSALAWGGRARPLRRHQPEATCRESAEFDVGIEHLDALVFALRRPVERLMARMEGRQLSVTKARLELELDDTEQADASLGRPKVRITQGPSLPAPRRKTESFELVLARPTLDARLMLDVVRDRLAHWQNGAAIWRASLEIAETGGRREQLVLGEGPRQREGLESALSRIQVRLGEDAAGCLAVAADHPPEMVSRMRPMEPLAGWTRADKGPLLPSSISRGAADLPPWAPATGLPLREWAPEEVFPEGARMGGWQAVRWRGDRHLVVACTEPSRLASRWWGQAAVRDYHDVLLSSGSVLRLFRDAEGRWWAQGIHD